MNEPSAPIDDKLNEPTQEQIAALAYLLWTSEGCPEGRHDADWHDAERQLLANDSSSNAGVDQQDEMPNITERSAYKLSHERINTSAL